MFALINTAQLKLFWLNRRTVEITTVMRVKSLFVYVVLRWLIDISVLVIRSVLKIELLTVHSAE